MFVGQSGHEGGRRFFLGAAVLTRCPPAHPLSVVPRFLVFIVFLVFFVFLGVGGPTPHACSRARTLANVEGVSRPALSRGGAPSHPSEGLGPRGRAQPRVNRPSPGRRRSLL